MMPGMAFEARVIGSTLGIGGVAAVCFTGIVRSKGPFIQTNYWKYAFSISLPTIVMSLSYMMMQQCDKVMIRNICGPEDTAVYAVIYYLGFAMIAVDQAAAPVRQAWIFHHLDNQDFTTTKIIQKWYLIIMCIIAVGLIMTGPEIVKIIAPRTYWKYEYITPFVLSACMMVLYRFNVEVILFYKSNNSLSISVLVCVLLNITLNALFIPAFGAVTACYTTVVSYGLLFVLTWFLANRHIQGIYEWKYFMFFIMATIGSAISFMTISDKALLRYVFLVLLLICTIVYTIHSRGEWSTVLWNRK
jgi:O-antigen/teichoic acid export membrane protein